jgi:hypothetical protein
MICLFIITVAMFHHAPAHELTAVPEKGLGAAGLMQPKAYCCEAFISLVNYLLHTPLFLSDDVGTMFLVHFL